MCNVCQQKKKKKSIPGGQSAPSCSPSFLRARHKDPLPRPRLRPLFLAKEKGTQVEIQKAIHAEAHREMHTERCTQRDKQRDKQRDTETHTQTQTHRHTHTQTHRHTDTQTHTHTLSFCWNVRRTGRPCPGRGVLMGFRVVEIACECVCLRSPSPFPFLDSLCPEFRLTAFRDSFVSFQLLLSSVCVVCSISQVSPKQARHNQTKPVFLALLLLLLLLLLCLLSHPGLPCRNTSASMNSNSAQPFSQVCSCISTTGRGRERGKRGRRESTHSLTHPPTHPPTHSLVGIAAKLKWQQLIWPAFPLRINGSQQQQQQQ